MLDETSQNRLKALLTVFLAENAKLNLSSLRTEEECEHGNVLDSLAALELPELRDAPAGALLLDIGTGGGFPLLPLAICLPQLSCTGLDSTRKKTDAVARIAAALELRNVSLIAGRAEEFAHDPDHRERYGIVTARAVAGVSTLLEYASPFARPGGCVILWKSMDIEQELASSARAQKELCCTLERRHAYTLPGGWGQRQLLVFHKHGALKPAYPRGVGIPKKNPL